VWVSLVVFGMGFSWWFLWWLLFCGVFYEKLLRLLLVVFLVVFLMGFGGWHGGGYCDYGGGCWLVLWWVCLVVARFFSWCRGWVYLVLWWVGSGGVGSGLDEGFVVVWAMVVVGFVGGGGGSLGCVWLGGIMAVGCAWWQDKLF